MDFKWEVLHHSLIYFAFFFFLNINYILRTEVDGQDLFVPAPTGQQGEQQGHWAPKSALPLSTRKVLLGLPRRSLTASRIEKLSECAGGMNRLLHVLMTWPVRVEPLAGPRAQAQGP